MNETDGVKVGFGQTVQDEELDIVVEEK